MRENKSMEKDRIHPRVLGKLDLARLCLSALEISGPSGKAVEDCRKADVAPIYKKGQEECLENYSPDSLTSFPGKMVE